MNNKIKKPPFNLHNILHYFLGNYRYKLYYSKYFRFLMRSFIYEQITWRIQVMDQECYEMGSCKLCGCQTTALQMCNKACDKPCYPSMLSKAMWEVFKQGHIILDKGIFWKHEEILKNPKQ